MAYSSVHIPAGAVFRIGDSIGAMDSLGVLDGDSQIEITYDPVEYVGSQGEDVLSYAKNAKANLQTNLVQLYLPNIGKLLDGIVTVTSQAATKVDDYSEIVASGSWAFNQFIELGKQNGDGSVLQIDVQGYPDVTAGTDGALTHGTDYQIVKNADGKWGIIILDSVNVTTESQQLTIAYDYTPAASKTLKMGAKSATLTRKIVELEKTISGKIFRVRIWSAINESGMTLAFPAASQDNPATLPVTMTGKIDTSRSEGEQLLEIYDEIGLTA